ncbi:MAG: hypothetical protein CUN55_07325 [Phototrophicales bacterium]|nr:MAG: hypothetical protein CUN55_07325 [Phototrophicales bacterium]
MKGKILVVEDDLYLMEGIRDILELAGYEVVTADSGKAGLDLLRNGLNPDLIVSDIMMPIMDGYEFLSAVRSEKQWVDIPFIFLTAKGERADENLGKELGADDYVTKPFGPDDLLVAVSAKLRRIKQLRQKQDQQFGELKRNIMTILYHEFNTPLTYVVAYNDMLKQIDAETLTADSLRVYLSGVDSGATRLRRLIENFILLVELETGEAEDSYVLHRGLIDDYQLLLAGLRNESEALLAERQQTLHVHIDPHTPAIVGYGDYVIKALRCLIDNASKFSSKGTTVDLHIYPSQEEQMVCFAVSDQGRGIPAHEIEHIFEPFYQVNRQDYEDQGSGTGLAIVKRIAELHGGKVEVTSEVGKGSTFRILLPTSI